MSHTPPPWAVEPYSDTDELLYIVANLKHLPNGGRQAVWIAECDMGDGDDPDVLETNQANARLIAEAPALLAALKALLAQLEIVHGDPQYMDVWATAQLHRGVYDGPQYAEEMTSARDVIARAEGREP